MKRLLIVCTVFATFLVSLAIAPSAVAQSCHAWPDGASLQNAINNYACVQISAGTYEILRPVNLPSNRTVRGAGINVTIIRAGSGYSNVSDGMFSANGSTNILITRFTVDGGGLAIGGIGANGITVDNMRITGAKCFGVGIAGTGMVVRYSVIEYNGTSCPNAPPGAGIYAEGVASNYAPQIYGNTIRNNVGPAVDVNGVWGGSLTNNTIYGNSSWAGVSLYGTSYWNVSGNSISHPSTATGQPYHPYCAGGPIGPGSAGIFLCQDTDTNNLVTVYNSITNNASSSRYGILSIGADEIAPYWAPPLNTFTGNNVFGSSYGCADDFYPGQWFNDDNTWSDNNCAGSPNTPPGYF